jgi:hypothetical protein
MNEPTFNFLGPAVKDGRPVMVFRCRTCQSGLYCDIPEALPDEIAKHQIDSPSCFPTSYTVIVHEEKPES